MTKRTGFQRRLGKCYELAGGYVLGHRDTVLVHGSIQRDPHPRIGHAWVILPDGLWLDLVTEYALPRDAFERFFNAEVDATFTYDETCGKALENEHWGPW